MPLRWPALAALAAGIVHTAAFAPVEWWWLQILALAVLAALADRRSPRQAALLGWCFGLGWLTSGLWWLYISMHRYGELPAPLAAAAVCLLAAALALYHALALGAWATLCTWSRAGLQRRAWMLAGCWLAAELARASWFTGFPWINPGYAHTSGPLAPWAPWVGVYGICALAALVAACLGLAGRAFWRRRVEGEGQAFARTSVGLLAIALAPLLAGSLLPQGFSRDAGELQVTLVQPNVAQNLKFDATHLKANLEALGALVRSSTGRLVVTPESVVPLPFDTVPADYWRELHGALARQDRAALVGVFLPDGSGKYVNSMVGLSAASPPEPGRFYAYGKRHLLPFGEFIPPGFGWFVRAMRIPLDDQASGTHGQSFAFGGQRLRPLICYEDLFGEDFVASVVGPASATVLVNASNLAWFGPLMMQDQHLQFSRMRALEFQRPVVRATNTGATAVVDHRGTVTQRLRPEVVGLMDATVMGRLGDTPYARWLVAWGLAPLWGVALALLAVGVRRRGLLE